MPSWFVEAASKVGSEAARSRDGGRRFAECVKVGVRGDSQKKCFKALLETLDLSHSELPAVVLVHPAGGKKGMLPKEEGGSKNPGKLSISPRRKSSTAGVLVLVHCTSYCSRVE